MTSSPGPSGSAFRFVRHPVANETSPSSCSPLSASERGVGGRGRTSRRRKRRPLPPAPSPNRGEAARGDRPRSWDRVSQLPAAPARPARYPARTPPVPHESQPCPVRSGLRSWSPPLATAPAAADPSPFAKFVDDYYAALFDWDPNQATYAGIHDRDARLADRSAAAVARRVDQLKQLAARLAALPADKLTEDEAIDAEVLDGRSGPSCSTWSRPRLAEATRWATSARRPRADRRAHEARLRPAARPGCARSSRRLRAAPAAVRRLRANVDNPPKEFTDLAIRMAQGLGRLLPRHACRPGPRRPPARTPSCSREFDAANDAVVEALTRRSPRGSRTTCCRGPRGVRHRRRQLREATPLRGDGRHPARRAAGHRRGQPEARTRRPSSPRPKKIDPTKTPGRGDEVALRRPPDGGRPDPVRAADDRGGPAVPRRQEDRHHPVGGAADASRRRRPTPARAASRRWTRPGAYETQGHRGVLLRHAGRRRTGTRKQKEEHLRLFNRPGRCSHQRPRGVPRPLPPVPLRQAVPDQDAQADLLRHATSRAGPTTASR